MGHVPISWLTYLPSTTRKSLLSPRLFEETFALFSILLYIVRKGGNPVGSRVMLIVKRSNPSSKTFAVLLYCLSGVLLSWVQLHLWFLNTFTIFKAAHAQAQPSTFYFCCCCVVSPVSAKLLLLYYLALLLSPVQSFSVLFSPVQTCSVLFSSVHSCSVLFSPALSCSVPAQSFQNGLSGLVQMIFLVFYSKSIDLGFCSAIQCLQLLFWQSQFYVLIDPF